MLTLKDLCIFIELVILTVCVAASPQLDQGYNDLTYRSADTDDIVAKPVRDDGLGSLLLKNLRFRDVDYEDQPHPLPLALLWNLRRFRDQSGVSDRDNEHSERKVEKRQSVSVSQLAELLHSLKARAIDDDGVKLQSLRFGK